MSKSTDISKELIMRYLSGEASAEEQQAVREAAKEDPFLAEAIEGLEENPSAAAASVSSLDEKVDERLGIKARPIIPMSIVWKVSAAAAAVLILVGSVFIFNNIKQQDQVAQSESPIVEEDAKTESSEAEETLAEPLEDGANTITFDNAPDSSLLAKDIKQPSYGGLQTGYQIAFGSSQQLENVYWYTSSPVTTAEGDDNGVSYLWDWSDRDDALSNDQYLALVFETEIPEAPEPVFDDLIAEADAMEEEPEEYEMNEEDMIIAGTMELGESEKRSETIAMNRSASEPGAFQSLDKSKSTIQGKVVDEYSGQPLTGANVYTPSGAGTMTDAEGNYRLEVESGEQEVIAGYLGYEQKSKKVSTPKDADVTLDLSLAPNSQSLEEVTVSKSGNNPSAYDEYFAGNYKSAAGKFDDIVKDDPGNLEAQYYLGLSNFNANKMNKAISAFDAILNQPANMFTDGARWYKAQALIEKGKESEALPLLQQLSSKQNSYQQSASEQLLDLEE